MYKINQEIDEKEYFKCNMYYLKKYLSIREVILMAILLVAAILFWVSLGNYLILIMFGVTSVLVAFAIIIFIITAKSAYKIDFEKREIIKQVLKFSELGLVVQSYNKAGERLYNEKYLLADIDKVALLKDRVYIYQGVATAFYIYPNYMEEGEYEEFRLFLIDKIDKQKFKMKTRFRQFPGYSNRRFRKDHNIGGHDGQS